MAAESKFTKEHVYEDHIQVSLKDPTEQVLVGTQSFEVAAGQVCIQACVS